MKFPAFTSFSSLHSDLHPTPYPKFRASFLSHFFWPVTTDISDHIPLLKIPSSFSFLTYLPLVLLLLLKLAFIFSFSLSPLTCRTGGAHYPLVFWGLWSSILLLPCYTWAITTVSMQPAQCHFLLSESKSQFLWCFLDTYALILTQEKKLSP